MNLCALALVVAAQTAAPAEPIPAEVAPPEAPIVTGWSNEQLDPHGLTRFHATTRALFKNGSAFSLEGRAQFRLAQGVTMSAVLPVAVLSKSGAAIGNIGAGVSFVSALGDGNLHLGGGLDIYAPSATENDTILQGTVAALRAYEPMLYLPKVFSVRARGYFDMEFDTVRASLELGLVPGAYIGDDGGFIMLASVSGRISAAVTPMIEPFLEAGTTPRIAGVGQVKPPVLITPGVRLHIGEVFDPALFVSFNFVEASAVIIGLDLAAAIRPTVGVQKREDGLGGDDFFDDF